MNSFPIDKIQERLDELKNQYPFSNDTDFMTKLKAFHSTEERLRRTGRTHAMARISLELAIESIQPVYIIDHFKMSFDLSNMNSHFMRAVEEWQEYYYNMGVEIILNYEPRYNRFSTKLRTEDSVKIYNEFRLKDYEFPKKEEKRQFSKLLLII